MNQESGELALTLKALTDRSRGLYSFEAEFNAEVAPQVSLSETSASHRYRIAQKALKNAARYVRAWAVSVLLQMAARKFLLQIPDDGIGIGIVERERSSSGIGLKIMKYRPGMIGTSFEIAPNEPCGTSVYISSEQSIVTSVLHSEQVI